MISNILPIYYIYIDRGQVFACKPFSWGQMIVDNYDLLSLAIKS